MPHLLLHARRYFRWFDASSATGPTEGSMSFRGLSVFIADIRNCTYHMLLTKK
jgi:hypothetical protein